jgi:hypothetical protein
MEKGGVEERVQQLPGETSGRRCKCREGRARTVGGGVAPAVGGPLEVVRTGELRLQRSSVNGAL